MPRLSVRLLLLASCGLAAADLFALPEPTKLLRFPDIHGGQVVFCYAGDLWLAPADGGDARRLTAHPGLELFPKFSPDGRWIAFTGQYDGDEQVYVVPAAGGVPRQLTWYPARGPLAARWGYDNQVHGWTPDGAKVLFRSLRDGFDTAGSRLYVVALDGGLPEALPMPQSGAGDFSPDAKRVAYSPHARDFRTWKRYAGGWAQDLYVFDLATHQLDRVTDHPRTDRDPMWIGESIYFSSDRDGKLNLYRYDLESRRTEQLTRSTDWDVRWPSTDGESRIVYEWGGELRIFDLGTHESRPIPIFAPNDGVAMRPSRIQFEPWVEDFSLAPSGERILVVARGDVFSVPVEKGPIRNLTRSSDAHDKWARWSPDGKRVAFVSDASGEDEVWWTAQDGSGKPEQLTTGGGGMLFAPGFSPDGQRIAIDDKEGRLFVIDVESRDKVLVADEERGLMGAYSWSPDGAHLALTLTEPSGFPSIHVWSAADRRLRRVTSEMFSESSPAWDPGGDYLFYLSSREYAPQISAAEWNYAVNRTVGIFAMALRKDVAHLFPPESDEVTLDETDEKEKKEKEKEKKEPAAGGKKDAEKEPMKIDFDGLAERVVRVPVDADNYGALAAVPGQLIYFRFPAFYYGRSPETPSQLFLYSLAKREPSSLGERVNGFAVSRDGKKVLVRQAGGFQIMDATAKSSGKVVATRGLEADHVPAEEWAQIFDEVWRRYRDFFYVENMHGYDWEAIREQYRPLLAHVAHRSDLNYVIGEMIAELNVGHAYVSGGDWNQPERPAYGLPGARFALDPAAGRYRLARVFRGQNEEERYRAPLTEVGVDAEEGEYVLAIDGEDLGANDNPYRLLRHKNDRPVTLTVAPTPAREGAREVTYRPVGDEQSLLYLAWVEASRRRVDEATGGRVGYLQLPDMGADGIREFIKHFYAQILREGLIVDVRRNGGGNVSPMVIERLARELLGTRFSRTSDSTGTYPNVVFTGPMVCLLDANSGSDGDVFPHMFREAGLGPLIGERSWGGVIGITNRGPLIDGGQVSVPEFGVNATDGGWIIEGHGVDPDIEVANDPKSVLEGRDPQLERAIREVSRLIEDRRPLPERPDPPVKTD